VSAAPAAGDRPAVEVRQLSKWYDDQCVLDAVDLVVEAGSVLALLGHNGAGKTTLVRILSTLEGADSGSALVNGHDVRTTGARVREQIALAGQYAAVDELLTGRQNLTMLARLMGLGRRASVRRAVELLAELDLADAADRKVETYSGGMRRRLDLAACIVTRPAVLFLDEPTTGVDPVTRGELWAAVSSLAALGVSVLLTTQYLEEAEQIADSVVVLEHGRVIAHGSPSEVTACAGGERIVVTLGQPADVDLVARLVEPLAGSEPTTDRRRSRVTFESPDPLGALGACARALAAAGVPVREVALRAPSLEEAFMHLTGGGRGPAPGAVGSAGAGSAGEPVADAVA